MNDDDSKIENEKVELKKNENVEEKRKNKKKLLLKPLKALI